jgi:hypothetical protein
MFKAMFIEAIGSAYICKKKKKNFWTTVIGEQTYFRTDLWSSS